jgi:GntR family negative regulator for fad regulon and positive regulator of fabA
MALRAASPQDRPVQHAQDELIAAILRGDFPPGAALPGERRLAAELGVTRPTLREALRQLAADGWLTIQHGKSTVVTDYLREGGLNVLTGLVRHSDRLPASFVPDLLQVRLDLAPTYTRLALTHAPGPVIAHLQQHTDLDDTPDAYARFDWALHQTLTRHCDNPIYAMITNGFAEFYVQVAAASYFASEAARRVSDGFYADLLAHALAGEIDDAVATTRRVMARSIELWKGQA